MLLISVLIFSILLFGCATQYVHDTKTDQDDDYMDCAYSVVYNAFAMDDCMLNKHGWRTK